MPIGEKQLLRNTLRRTLAELTPAYRTQASASIRNHLHALPAFREAKVVYGIFPMATEPDWLGGMLPADKIICMPRIEGQLLKFVQVKSLSGLVKGPFGALEPPPGPSAPLPDLVLAPGMAFDAQGNRLGRGAGYFDRFLASRNYHCIGLAFACQIIPRVPAYAHDQKMAKVVTENGVMTFVGETPSHRD